MNENEQAQQVPLAEQVRQQETELHRLRAAYATAIAALDGTKTRQDRLDALDGQHFAPRSARF